MFLKECFVIQLQNLYSVLVEVAQLTIKMCRLEVRKNMLSFLVLCVYIYIRRRCSSQKGDEFSRSSSEFFFPSLSYIRFFSFQVEKFQMFYTKQSFKSKCKHNLVDVLRCCTILEALPKPTVFQQHSHV